MAQGEPDNKMTHKKGSTKLVSLKEIFEGLPKPEKAKDGSEAVTLEKEPLLNYAQKEQVREIFREEIEKIQREQFKSLLIGINPIENKRLRKKTA